MSKRMLIVPFLVFLSLFFAGGIAFPSSPASPDMAEGEWEASFDTQIEGMPFSVPGMSFKIKQCLTKEDVVPRNKKEEDKCKIRDMKVAGNNVKWTIECVEKDATTVGEGDITYSGSSYKGTMKNTITDKKGAVTRMTTKLAGKRIGECKNTGAKKDHEPKKGASNADDGSCTMAGFDSAASPDCEKKFGKLDFNEGNWTINKEEIRTVVMVTPPQVSKNKDSDEECIEKSGPAPLFITQDPCIKDIRRNGNKLSWTVECTNMFGQNEGTGELAYSGDKMIGAINIKISNGGMPMQNVSVKFSGARTGDCARAEAVTPKPTTGRDYTSSGRDYTSSPRSDASAVDSGVDKARRKIKGILGW